jgi:hypothetical protein
LSKKKTRFFKEKNIFIENQLSRKKEKKHPFRPKYFSTSAKEEGKKVSKKLRRSFISLDAACTKWLNLSSELHKLGQPILLQPPLELLKLQV